MPERKAVGRRRERVMQMLHTLPPAAQQAIRMSYASEAQPAMAGAPSPLPQRNRGLLGGPAPDDTDVITPEAGPPTWAGGPSSGPGTQGPPPGPGRHRPRPGQ
jgi:phospholipid/cholesterol/gamma-HCH transport system ATP-binding protein